MNITRAVITAAGPDQRRLPHQLLVDSDGVEKSVLKIIVAEATRAGIDDIGVVVHPDDTELFQTSLANEGNWTVIPQHEPRGYGHAIYCARDFVGNQPFLHMVGDHVYVSRDDENSTSRLLALAAREECTVSSVQPTREHEIGYFGAVSGQRVRGTHDVYTVDGVIEKPTPTQAEQALVVPGLRAGNYLCFFGIHVLTPSIFALMTPLVERGDTRIGLSDSLNELAKSEKYLAIEANGLRFPMDAKYGRLRAQLALGLHGRDRAEILTLVCDLLAQRELISSKHQN